MKKQSVYICQLPLSHDVTIINCSQDQINFENFKGMQLLPLKTSVFILLFSFFRCAIPSLTNDTFQVQSPAHEWMLNMSVPPKSSCHLYAPGNYTYDSHYRPINASRIPCNLWVYDTSVFTTTVASQVISLGLLHLKTKYTSNQIV